MLTMFVTLEVSQLSGWLKACASCRVEREGHAMRGEVRAGRREGVWGGGGASGVHAGKRPDSRLEGQGARGAHVEHAVHGRDLGGVKAQRLVERRRVLPSRREEHAIWSEVQEAGRRGAWGGGGASGVHGEGPTQGLGVRARAERTENM
jgi:hypothetical protein